MINKNEIETAELLLDIGISVAVRPLRFLSKRLQIKRVVIRRPYLGGIVNISRYYAMMGTTSDEYKQMNRADQIAFIARNGQLVSLLVACCICRSWIANKLFKRLTAWWLRWRVHPDVLAELAMIVISQVNTKNFQIIISCGEAMNTLKPRLSQK